MRWMLHMGTVLFFIAGMVCAQPINLTNPETLDVPTSQRAIWTGIHIYPPERKMIVDYMWVTPAGEPISVGGSIAQQWVCRNIDTPGENADCVASASPHPCCTGAGTGTCDGLDDSCFSDIFSSTIPAGAVGTQIGAGFRTLLKNTWRDRELSAGNDGAFE